MARTRYVLSNRHFLSALARTTEIRGRLNRTLKLSSPGEAKLIIHNQDYSRVYQEQKKVTKTEAVVDSCVFIASMMWSFLKHGPKETIGEILSRYQPVPSTVKHFDQIDVKLARIFSKLEDMEKRMPEKTKKYQFAEKAVFELADSNPAKSNNSDRDKNDNSDNGC